MVFYCFMFYENEHLQNLNLHEPQLITEAI